MPRRKTITNSKIKYLLSAAVLLVGGGTVLELTNNTDFIHQPEQRGSPVQQGSAPLNGESPDPAAEAKKQPPEQKKSVNAGQKNNVTPQIAYVRQDNSGDPLLVKAYIPGIFEGGGTCTAILTRDSTTVTGSVTAFGNVSETNCPQINIPRHKFGSGGTWYLIVSYSSPKSGGISAEQKVEIK